MILFSYSAVKLYDLKFFFLFHLSEYFTLLLTSEMFFSFLNVSFLKVVGSFFVKIISSQKMIVIYSNYSQILINQNKYKIAEEHLSKSINFYYDLYISDNYEYKPFLKKLINNITSIKSKKTKI